MSRKMSPLYVMAVFDVVLGLFIFFLNTLFKMDLFDFDKGFCMVVGGVLMLSGAALVVWHSIYKKKSL